MLSHSSASFRSSSTLLKLNSRVFPSSFPSLSFRVTGSVMTSRKMSTAKPYTVSPSQPDDSVAPSFYRAVPPPHWTNVPAPSSSSSNSTGKEQLNISKRKFASPWESAVSHGFLGFLRARLFDWDEVPLPPKVAPSSSSTDSAKAAVLPPVQKPNWTAKPGSDQKEEQGITFTWLGHAICHIQIPIRGNKSMTILCDPVLSRRVSPVQWFGPERYTDSPVSVEQIIEDTLHGGKKAWPDVLVLSHNHYDHMDFNTIQKLLNPPSETGLKRPHVFCTLGNKAWFQSNFGLQEDEVTESDWWQQSIVLSSTPAKEEVLKVTCVPAQHFAGRGLLDRDRTLWGGWVFQAISGSDKEAANVYFAGDTGYRSVPRGMPKESEDTLPFCPAFKEIGETLGPFDLSLIPIGAYLPRHVMSTIHLAPQDSVLVHKDVKSRKSFGIHWGAFRLTPEDVNEPPRLLKEEAKRVGLADDEFGVVQIGQSVFVPVASNNSTKSAVESTNAKETTQTTEQSEALPESKLGTKEHWDSVYQREVSTFAEIGEEGEIWFGEDSVMRMIRFLEKYFTELNTTFAEGSSPAILDLGTGNGHLLFSMLEDSADLEDVLEATNLVGIDYSLSSIELSKAIAKKRGGDCEEVRFLTSDILNSQDLQQLVSYPQTNLGKASNGWDVICDKGTLDAIALSSKPINGQLPIDVYSNAIKNLLNQQQKGIFLITSCNFTEEELIQRFSNKLGLEVLEVLPTPSFTFAGAKGSSTTSIAFRAA